MLSDILGLHGDYKIFRDFTPKVESQMDKDMEMKGRLGLRSGLSGFYELLTKLLLPRDHAGWI